MKTGLSASARPPCFCSNLCCKTLRYPSIPVLSDFRLCQFSCSSLSLSPRTCFPRLCCSSSPGSSGSGESDSRTIVDAFFLGKALGEALTERIESAVGEFLSTVGRLQAEQQRQIQDFQEDVVERARRAKEKAAREVLEEQGRLIPKSATVNASVTNGSSSTTVSTYGGSVNPASSVSTYGGSVNPASSVSTDDTDKLASSDDENQGNEDSPSSIPIDE